MIYGGSNSICDVIVGGVGCGLDDQRVQGFQERGSEDRTFTDSADGTGCADKRCGGVTEAQTGQRVKWRADRFDARDGDAAGGAGWPENFARGVKIKDDSPARND